MESVLTSLKTKRGNDYAMDELTKKLFRGIRKMLRK